MRNTSHQWRALVRQRCSQLVIQLDGRRRWLPLQELLLASSSNAWWLRHRGRERRTGTGMRSPLECSRRREARPGRCGWRSTPTRQSCPCRHRQTCPWGPAPTRHRERGGWGEAKGAAVSAAAREAACPRDTGQQRLLSGMLAGAEPERAPASAPPTCAAQPKWHQLFGYSLAPSKQEASCGQPPLPQCRRAQHFSWKYFITAWGSRGRSSSRWGMDGRVLCAIAQS